MTLGELVQERMAAAARCSPTAVAALQWVGRGGDLRTCDLAEALGITMPGASQVVASLIADGLVQRTRYPHDQRQWRLHLTELGGARTLEAVRARAGAVRELVETLPFPWRLRLIRILERLLGRMVDSPPTVFRVCRPLRLDRLQTLRHRAVPRRPGAGRVDDVEQACLRARAPEAVGVDRRA